MSKPSFGRNQVSVFLACLLTPRHCMLFGWQMQCMHQELHWLSVLDCQCTARCLNGQCAEKRQTACAVNEPDCLSWQPSANALPASSELTVPFMQVNACSQAWHDIMISVLLCFRHLRNLVIHTSSKHHLNTDYEENMLCHVDLCAHTMICMRSCSLIWCCIQICFVQGTPFESELEYLAYGCQGDPLVQTAVLSFQQQTALRVSPPFTQVVQEVHWSQR